MKGRRREGEGELGLEDALVYAYGISGRPLYARLQDGSSEPARVVMLDLGTPRREGTQSRGACDRGQEPHWERSQGIEYLDATLLPLLWQARSVGNGRRRDVGIERKCEVKA